MTNDDKKYDASQMIESVISSIVQYFSCDYAKLIDALESLIHMRDIDEYTKYSDIENTFDISDSKINVTVKGFLSKGKPILFFYVGDNENPSGIVKTSSEDKKDIYSIEISNSTEVLSSYKKDMADLTNSYVFVNEFAYEGDVCTTTHKILAETDSNNQMTFDVLDTAEVEDEHKNFIILLNNAMAKSGLNFSKLSGFGADILFLSFYDEVKNLCENDELLPLGDLIHIINETIYPEKKQIDGFNSVLVDAIGGESLVLDENQQKKFSFMINYAGKDYRYEIVKSEKYFSVEVFDGADKISGAMIVSSADGFSFIRSNGSLTSTDIASIVINVSENKLKFMTIDAGQDKKSKYRKIETVLSFSPDGAIKLESSDMKTQKVKKNKNVLSKVTLGD